MSKKLSIEECNETYWKAHPNLRGLIEIQNIWREESSTGKSKHTYISLFEIETNRKCEKMLWCLAKNPKKTGVPDTFASHPHSIENMNEVYWNAHPNLRGLVQITNKWYEKSSTGKGLNAFISLLETSTGKTHNMIWSSAKNIKRFGVPDEFDCHPYSLKSMTETYWNAHPELRGLVQITNKWCVPTATGKSNHMHVSLREMSTNRIHDMRWTSAKTATNAGIPDTFDCHPYSLKSMTEKYWNIHSNLRGLVQITNKWCEKNKSGNSSSRISIQETLSGKTHDMDWGHAISPKCEGVPPHFDCYSGTKNLPCNDKLCLVYFCKTTTYGEYDKHKNGPYLTIGKTTQGSAKQRYISNSHIKTYFEFETYNCNIHEKSLLDQITALLGQPEAGTEAWQWSQNREDAIKKLFLDHFLKDYIESI